MKRKRPVRLAHGSSDERKLRKTLTRRARVEGPGLGSSPLPACESARRFWSERAWSEFAAVPSMSQTALAMVREEASLDALGVVTTIAVDEIRHTEMSRDLAERLGGYVADIPAGAVYEPQILGNPTDTPLAYWVVANGCISETVSFELLRARLDYAAHPSVHGVLKRIFQDEAVHARSGWALAEALLPSLDQTTRRALAEYAAGMFEILGKSFATCGLPPKARREARKVRSITAEKGLGACPPDVADGVVARTVTEVVVPRLTALGLPLV